MPATAWAAADSSRAATTTRKPRAASWRAASRPMPRLAPVINAMRWLMADSSQGEGGALETGGQGVPQRQLDRDGIAVNAGAGQAGQGEVGQVGGHVADGAGLLG